MTTPEETSAAIREVSAAANRAANIADGIRAGRKIAWALTGIGAALILFGVIGWLVATYSMDGTLEGAATAAGVISSGGVIALFGLHAEAVRPRW